MSQMKLDKIKRDLFAEQMKEVKYSPDLTQTK